MNYACQCANEAPSIPRIATKNDEAGWDAHIYLYKSYLRAVIPFHFSLAFSLAVFLAQFATRFEAAEPFDLKQTNRSANSQREVGASWRDLAKNVCPFSDIIVTHIAHKYNR